MGVQQSKEELLYQQVSYGNIEEIRMLRSQGAGLEWVDKEGKTPLIVACLRHDLLPVAKLLIEMGANVNCYRPGCHAGTPLHHAAKKGYGQIVHLLLSNGANPFILNDDCQTALDLAREKGHLNVIRAIESRISLFSGWLREAYGPGFLEAFAPQLLMRKIWAAVLPCDARNPTRPLKFELAIYSDLQTPRPRTVISLWKAQIDEPKFNQADPAVIVVDKATRARYKLLSAHEGDKQQLQRLLSACRGISQVANVPPMMPIGALMPIAPQMNPNVSTQTVVLPASNQEDIDMAMAINASIQTAMAEGVPHIQPNRQTANTNGWGSSSDRTTYNGWGITQSVDTPPKTNNQMPINESNISGWAVPRVQLNTNGWGSSSDSTTYNGWGITQSVDTPPKTNNQMPINESNISGWAVPGVQLNASAVLPNLQNTDIPVCHSTQGTTSSHLIPSAPPIAEDIDGPIQYPSIDCSPINMSTTAAEIAPGNTEDTDSATSFPKPESKGDKESSTSTSNCCVICLDAPVEGACIPCGHMAGCMTCLREIETKKWGCPVCRTNIDRVIKLYAV